jgi:hypothetical protein
MEGFKSPDSLMKKIGLEGEITIEEREGYLKLMPTDT